MSKFVKRNNLQEIYFDRVIHLYFEENLGYTQISHLVPIGRTTILEWVHRYLDSGLDEVIEMKAKKKKRQEEHPRYRRYYYSEEVPDQPSDKLSVEALETLVADLKKRNQELEDQLLKETIWSEALDELINVAEENFRIPIRKKLAPNGRSLARKGPEEI